MGPFNLDSTLMKRVWQNIRGQDGNCMQAAVASLLELNLDSVPNFKTFGKMAMRCMIDFMWDNGYSFVMLVRPRHGLRLISNEPGVDGHFFAVVRSVANHGGHHAVIIDRECNIVHPVNSEYDGMTEFERRSEDEINGITYVFVFNPTKPGETKELLERRRMSRKNNIRSKMFKC